MNFWMCFGLCSIVVIHFVAMSNGHWYIVNLDLNRCLTCGKLIVTFGELLEKMTDISKGAYNDMYKETDNITDVDGDVDDMTYGGSIHDLRNIKFGTDESDVLAEFTIENHIIVYIGLLKNFLCSDHLTICINIDHNVASSAFDSIKSIQNMQDTIPSIKLCKYLSTVVLLITIGVVAWDVVSPSTAIAGFSLYSLFSLGAVIIASVPYFVLTTYDVISLCVPWAYVLTLLSSYISALIAYNLKMRQNSSEQSLTMWQIREMKLV